MRGSNLSFTEKMIEKLPIAGAFAVAITFAIVLTSVFWPYLPLIGNSKITLLQALADKELARGLITFLVAVTTVGIAFVVIVYVTLGKHAEVKAMFPLAKDVLAVFMGVLGTIVGFYFGSTQKSETEPAAEVQQDQAATDDENAAPP